MIIANMDNKKDTLLYAKFIADVGAKWYLFMQCILTYSMKW